ncbi:hypothetical protein [Lignipirellula cremea]|uniref:Uncharacterized protein n=1 Tax=Lignipirellula cremea TaxID=2528010 RepID=A0A518E3L8_9BACT|nr:hypothetical protein [Lignipirellula cremea]QDU98688.1 hypothetical protein Pla8534_65610 [Lignipirellula cremea]
MSRLVSSIPCCAATAVLVLGLISSAEAAGKEVVQYRLTEQRTLHLDDAKVAKQYHETMQQLGCETQLDDHGGHVDLTYRCREWREVDFPDHAAAHKWESWLKALRFEVNHTH